MRTKARPKPPAAQFKSRDDWYQRDSDQLWMLDQAFSTRARARAVANQCDDYFFVPTRIVFEDGIGWLVISDCDPFQEV